MTNEIIAIGGDNSGRILYAHRGFDYVGHGYDKYRTRWHSTLYELADRYQKTGYYGLVLLVGSISNPTYSWPFWAYIPHE